MAVLFITAVSVIAGCSRTPRAEEFIPSHDQARAALEATLQAWVNGDGTSAITQSSPVVEVSDGLRTKGRTLLKYEILGPVPDDAPRCFAVRLTLGNPSQELRERYVVLGLDPIWVWRHDDYLMLTHWDHSMVENQNKKSTLASKR